MEKPPTMARMDGGVGPFGARLRLRDFSHELSYFAFGITRFRREIEVWSQDFEDEVCEATADVCDSSFACVIFKSPSDHTLQHGTAWRAEIADWRRWEAQVRCTR